MWWSWWYSRNFLATGTTSGRLPNRASSLLYDGFLKARKWLRRGAGEGGEEEGEGGSLMWRHRDASWLGAA